jgi:capsular exopolysaccharide synthesis family protein
VGLDAYLRILRGRWLIVMAAVVIALGAGWLTATFAPTPAPPPTTYTASTLLLNTGGFGGSFGSGPTSGLSLSTIAAITTIDAVAERVADRLGYEGDPLALSARVSASADTTAGTLQIRAVSSRPRDAEVLADTFAKELLGYLHDRTAESAATQMEAIREQLVQLDEEIAALDRQIPATSETQAQILRAERDGKIVSYSNLSQQYQTLLSSQNQPLGLDIIQEAVARRATATTGFQPPSSLTARLVVSGIVGLLLGAGLALVVERMRPKIRTRDDAEQRYGAPVIAEIPRIPWPERGELVTVARPRSAAANAFRLLVAGISRGYPSANTILVTSPGPSEGKTTVVANLAVAFADVGRSVVILSCDFTRPHVHTLFGVPSGPGLAEGLASMNGRPVLDGCLHETPLRDVRLVAAGNRPENPSELFSSSKMRSAIAEARKLADVVLLDTAPLLSEADAAHLVPYVDAVLVVAREGHTSTELAERAREALARLHAPLVGVVLNEAAEAVAPRYDYHARTAEKDDRDRVGDIPS